MFCAYEVNLVSEKCDQASLSKFAWRIQQQLEQEQSVTA